MSNPGTPPPGAPQNNQPNVPPGGYAPPPNQPPPQYNPQQGYSYPAAPQPVAPPKRRSPLLFILLTILGVIVVCVVGVFLLIGGIFAATQPVVDAGDAYMAALRDTDYSRAFDLSSTALQQKAVDASGLETALSSKVPATWTFTSRGINNNDGSLSGNDTYKDGTTGTVELSLLKEGDKWKVDGINLK